MNPAIPLSPLTAFALAARLPDEALDLEALSVGIARIGRPNVTETEVQQALDRMSDEVADSVDPSAPPDRLARQLRAALGGRLDLRGDPELYRHETASFIDRVLETRRGLPILLSVVWVLLGQRLGVNIAPVGFPGHFIVCIGESAARIYLDPYGGGGMLDTQVLLARLGPDRRDRALMEPCGVRPTVTRMLTNLKHLYVERQDWATALGVMDRLLLIGGEVPGVVRDRGLIAQRVGQSSEAVRDLRRYLKLMPDAPDRAAVEQVLSKLGG